MCEFIRRVLDESAQLQLPATGKLVSLTRSLLDVEGARYLKLYNAIEATCAAAFEISIAPSKANLRRMGRRSR